MDTIKAENKLCIFQPVYRKYFHSAPSEAKCMVHQNMATDKIINFSFDSNKKQPGHFIVR